RSYARDSQAFSAPSPPVAGGPSSWGDLSFWRRLHAPENISGRSGTHRAKQPHESPVLQTTCEPRAVIQENYCREPPTKAPENEGADLGPPLGRGTRKIRHYATL